MEDRRNTVQPTDQMLLERVARRDLPALETLYDRYSAAALGLAMRMVGERNRAEEIIQEAFWQVWKRADRCMGRGGEFSSWLFSIAHHLAIEELRRQRSGLLSTSMDVEDENVLDFLASSVDIAQVAPQTPDSAQIRGAFMELLEPERRVIELMYFEGLTPEEIAEQLGEAVSTIHTRVRHALQLLHQPLVPLHLDI